MVTVANMHFCVLVQKRLHPYAIGAALHPALRGKAWHTGRASEENWPVLFPYRASPKSGVEIIAPVV
jgi:hypothetical protein